MKLISKEVSRAEPEYMNIHPPPPPPPISVLATALSIRYSQAEIKQTSKFKSETVEENWEGKA